MKCLACFGSGKVAERGEPQDDERRRVYCRRCNGNGVEPYDAPKAEVPA